MEARQILEHLLASGPVFWSAVVLMFIVMLWGLKTQVKEGNFPATLVFGIGAIVLLSVSVMGFAMYLEKSSARNSQGRSNTKINVEKDGAR